VTWRFSRGPALALSSFGDPTLASGFALCLYDDGTLKLQAQVGASPTLWRRSGTRFTYKDNAGSGDGIVKVNLRSGANGRSKIDVAGKGINLRLPTPFSGTRFFSNATGVLVQLHQDDGSCYQTQFTAEHGKPNKRTRFSARF